MSDRLSYEETKELPDSVFGLPERREYPMLDAAHACGRGIFPLLSRGIEASKLARAILARARGVRRRRGVARGAQLCPFIAPRSRANCGSENAPTAEVKHANCGNENAPTVEAKTRQL